MRSGFLALCILLSAIVGCSYQAHDIPAQFQGEWVRDLRYCGKADPASLNISVQKLEYWESLGKVKSVISRAGDELALIAEFSGEGERWLGFAHFKLSVDNERLTDITDRYAAPFIRMRCSKKEYIEQ